MRLAVRIRLVNSKTGAVSSESAKNALVKVTRLTKSLLFHRLGCRFTIMRSTQTLRDSFAVALTDSLLIRYQNIPSAAFLAKEFNKRARSHPITQESARRWLRGLAIPELEKLLVLRAWLSLDLNTLSQPNTDSQEHRQVVIENQLNEQQKVFVETIHLIKESLQSLMKEVEQLEKKLTLLNRTTVIT